MEELATILENTEKIDEMIAESLLQLLSNQFTYYEIAIVKLYLMHYICRLVSWNVIIRFINYTWFTHGEGSNQWIGFSMTETSVIQRVNR